MSQYTDALGSAPDPSGSTVYIPLGDPGDTDNTILHERGVSKLHIAEHPSPLTVLPSSHVSPLPMMPSPQRTAQVPAEQLWPVVHAFAEKPSPSVLQTWREVVLAQTVEALPGVQVRSVQAPAPVQA